MEPSRYTSPSRTSRSAATRPRVAARSRPTVSSATASALRPGARSTGIPAAVAPGTSTLVGSPRVAPMASSGRSRTGPAHRSASQISTVALTSVARAASCSAEYSRSGWWSIHGSSTTSPRARKASRPGPRSGAVARMTRSATAAEILTVGRKLDLGRGLGHDRVVLVAQFDPDGGDVPTLALHPGVAPLSRQERGVAGEGRAAVLGRGVRDVAPLAGPGGHVVEDPGTHGGAVPVAPGHAHMLGPAGLEVAPRRAVVGAVGQLGVEALHAAVALVARHLLGVAQLLGPHRGGALGGGAPGGHGEGPPLGGEAGQAVRAEHVLGQPVADRHRLEGPGIVA